MIAIAPRHSKRKILSASNDATDFFKQDQSKKFNQIVVYLKNAIETNDTLAVVGRILDWLKSPESRYPISCTVLSVEDSMECTNGIEYSWLYTSKGLRYAAGVALDLSKLRANGTSNGKGLIASGAASFAQIYSIQNEILRKGGTFKNGAVVTFLDANHPDVLEFIGLKSSQIPWIKRAIYVDDNPDSSDYILNNPNLNIILDAVRNGTVWLAKKRWYDKVARKSVNHPVNLENIWEYRLFSQVCQEILLSSNATCLLSHVNLGKCDLNNLVKSFTDAMTFLCKLHSITGAGKDNYYLSPKEDKQVGLGVIGLANMLANMNITYQNFTDALYDFLTVYEYWYIVYDALTEPKSLREIYKLSRNLNKTYGFKELRLVRKLYTAFQASARVARRYKMERVFTVAPTANVSYNNTDSLGYTTTPEISPPICHPITKKSIRDSDTMGIKEYQYPPNVETAEQVGWDCYYKLVKAWQLLMESTGLAHSISFNVWNQCPVDLEWFKDWLDSPLVTTYYRMMVDQGFADKTNVDAGLSIELSDVNDDFFTPVASGNDFCPINPDELCSACSE